MDAKKVARLCGIIKEKAERDDDYEDIYGILWEKGVKLCNGNAEQFYRLCEDALKDAPGVPS